MVYPAGTIETALVKCENGICIMRAEAMIKEDNGMRVLGTGTAYEKEGSSFINNTSYIENCETSAVGRALGMAGFGIDTSIRSAEETENAELQQEDLKPITKSNLNILQSLIKELPNAKTWYEGLLKEYEITDLSQLNSKQYGKILTEIKKIKEV